MGQLINKINFNPFSGQTPAAQKAQTFAPQSLPVGIAGINSPAKQVSFGHLAGITKQGPGSFLSAPSDQAGLGDRAILSKNGEAGRNLYIQA